MWPKSARGRTRVIGPGRRHPVPIALDAAAWKGGIVAGDDNRIYFSDGISWRGVTFADEALSLVEAPALVTVGPGGDYPTLNEAFLFLARFAPPRLGFTVLTRSEIRILSGYTVTGPLFVSGLDFEWVDVTAEGAVINVPFSACGSPNNIVSDAARYFMVFDGNGPYFNDVVFRLNHTWTGSGQLIDGFRPYGIRANGRLTIFKGGFQNFSVNIRCAANSVVDIIGSDKMIDGRQYSIEVIYGATCSCRAVVARAAVGNSVYVRHGGVFSTRFNAGDAAELGFAVSDFRKTAGSDSSSDIRVHHGAIAHLDETTLGGTTQPVNVPTGDGIIFKSGAGFALREWPGIIAPQSYTVATVPSAAAYPSRLIHVSNGDSGAPCLAVSNGTNWLRIPLGAAVST